MASYTGNFSHVDQNQQCLIAAFCEDLYFEDVTEAEQYTRID